MKVLNEAILLTTTKGDKVLINFENIAYCKSTKGDNSILYFAKSPEKKQEKGEYLIVQEKINFIKRLLQGKRKRV